MSEVILQFTDAAVDHIKKSLNRFNEGGFRVGVKKTGCSGYKYLPEIIAAPKTNDVEFMTEQGLRVFVDSAWVDVIKGTKVDLKDKGFGQKQLVFYNPNASGECGCGESFHLPEN